VIDSAEEEDGAVAAAAGDSEVDDENYAWNSPIFFLKLKP
jgi:hypothetical protein